jgi:hypothetical protein
MRPGNPAFFVDAHRIIQKNASGVWAAGSMQKIEQSDIKDGNDNKVLTFLQPARAGLNLVSATTPN